MSHCDACNQEGVVSFSIQVHSFPKDAKLRKQWIRAVKNAVEGWTPREDSVLCSKHFEDNCYKEPDPVLGKVGMMCRGLRDNALPTIFKNAQTTAPVQESHRENGRLKSDDLEACSKGKVTDENKQAMEELQPRTLRSTRSQDRSNGKVDVVTMSKDEPPATSDKEVHHDDHKEDDEDLNLPLRKVFEQMAKIKEERAKLAAVNQGRREGKDKWWNSKSKDFRKNLETHMQQLEMSRSKLPVTFDTAMSTTLSVLGESQEIIRVKDELTVPCLGKLYCRERTLCPRCGNPLDDMMKIVRHLCKAKARFLSTRRFYDSIPDIVLIKEYQWQRLVQTHPESCSKSWRKKAKRKEPEEMATKSGLVDVFSLQEMHKPSDEPSSPNSGKEETKIKNCNRNLWKRLKLKQTKKISRNRSPILKRDALIGGFKPVKSHVRGRSNSETSKGELTTVKMHIRAKRNSKAVKGQSKKKLKKKSREYRSYKTLTDRLKGTNIEGNTEEERTSLEFTRRNYKELTDRLQEKEMEDITTFGDMTVEAAADLLFSNHMSVKKEPVDPEYELQSDMGHLDGQPIGDRIHAPQVYPVGIIPSTMLLTSLNTAPDYVSNDSIDEDVKPFLPGSQMGSLPSDQAFQSPVQYGNPGPVMCDRCSTWCENETELGWHQCLDSSSAPPVGAGGRDGGRGDGITGGSDGGIIGGGGGITLADGTVVKAEPMDDDR